MKYNSLIKEKGTVKNYEGAKAYAMTPEMELYTAVVIHNSLPLFLFNITGRQIEAAFFKHTLYQLSYRYWTGEDSNLRPHVILRRTPLLRHLLNLNTLQISKRYTRI